MHDSINKKQYMPYLLAPWHTNMTKTLYDSGIKVIEAFSS
jgi:hypothetical protein